MKECAFCGKPLPIPTNSKTRNYKYCNIHCRNQSYRPYNKEWQRKKADRLAVKSEAKIQCMFCGRWYLQIGTHITQREGMTAREYREYFELEVKKGLTKGWYKELKASQVFENGTWENLKAGKKFWFKKGGKVPIYKRSLITLEKLALNRAKRKGVKNYDKETRNN